MNIMYFKNRIYYKDYFLIFLLYLTKGLNCRDIFNHYYQLHTSFVITMLE